MTILATDLISAYLPVGAQGIQGITGSQGVISWVTKFANYTANANEAIMAITTSGSFTITLPPAPTTGNIVIISDGNNFATNPLIVSGGGKLIEGYDTFTLNIQHVKAEFVYDGTAWQIFPTITGGVGSSNLDGLTDVIINTSEPLTTNDVLLYNGTNWANDPSFNNFVSEANAILNPVVRQTDTTKIVAISVGATAPSSPVTGDLWIDTN